MFETITYYLYFPIVAIITLNGFFTLFLEGSIYGIKEFFYNFLFTLSFIIPGIIGYYFNIEWWGVLLGWLILIEIMLIIALMNEDL